MAMGWATHLEDGRWRYFASQGSGPGRVTANATRETKRDAKAAAEAKLEAKMRAASFPDALSLTLAAYIERYLTHVENQNGSLRATYLTKWSLRRLPPELSRKKLKELTPHHLQLWVDDLATRNAPSTVRKEFGYLRTALERATDWGIIAANPAAKVRPPKQSRADLRILDESETEALYARLAGDYLQPLFLVAVTTGLRRSELLALRWEDVDLDEATLRVCRKVEHMPGAKAKSETMLKTESSRRTVRLLPQTVACLRLHKKAQTEQRLAAKDWTDHGLVFPDRRGALLNPATVSSDWAERKTGVRFHDLRHSHATQLLRAGVPITAVSRRLGHANPAITMRVYSHVLADDDIVAVEKLTDRFSAGLGG